VAKELERLIRASIPGIAQEKIDVFPQGGSGGVVRILGRSHRAAKDSPCDVALDWNGLPSDLKSIVPASTLLIRKIAEQSAALYVPPAKIGALPKVGSVADATIQKLSSAAQALIAQNWENESDKFSTLLGIMRDVEQHFGKGEQGSAVAQQVCRYLLDRNPNVTTSNSDDRNPLQWERMGRSAWQIISRSKPSKQWKPQSLNGRKLQKGTKAVYKALSKFVLDKHLDPHNFRKDFGNIARWLTDKMRRPVSKAQARYFVLRAQEEGLLLILDPGLSNAAAGKGSHGKCTRYCLIGDEETVEQFKA
jgi:hypothetical protein